MSRVSFCNLFNLSDSSKGPSNLNKGLFLKDSLLFTSTSAPPSYVLPITNSIEIINKFIIKMLESRIIDYNEEPYLE
jgi:hypothetical protein